MLLKGKRFQPDLNVVHDEGLSRDETSGIPLTNVIVEWQWAERLTKGQSQGGKAFICHSHVVGGSGGSKIVSSPTGASRAPTGVRALG